MIADIDIKYNRLLFQALSKANLSDKPCYLFGSSARGNHRPHSDIDIWVDSPLSEKVWHQFQAFLEDQNMPYKVDLIGNETLERSPLLVAEVHSLRRPLDFT